MDFDPRFTLPQNPESVRKPESKISVWIPDSEKTFTISMRYSRIRNPDCCRIRSVPDSGNNSIKSIYYSRIRNPFFPAYKGVCPPKRLGTSPACFALISISQPIQAKPP